MVTSTRGGVKCASLTGGMCVNNKGSVNDKGGVNCSS
jgi:hypothetical protein